MTEAEKIAMLQEAVTDGVMVFATMQRMSGGPDELELFSAMQEYYEAVLIGTGAMPNDGRLFRKAAGTA